MMDLVRRVRVSGVVRLARAWVAAAVLLTLVVAPGSAAAAGASHDTSVSQMPSGRTPHVLDGPVLGDDRVLDIERIGTRIVVAGEFTHVQDSSANGGTQHRRNYVFAFDAATGAIDRTFVPAVNGLVRTVAEGPNGTVFLGGTFSTVNGQTRRNIAQVSLINGSTTAFRTESVNGAVNDLQLSNGRLFLGGVFNSVGGQSHGGLATVHPVSGAVDAYMGIDVAVNHNYPRGTARAPVGVKKLDITPDGSRLIAIGNFRLADGQTRDQVVMIRLGTSAAVVDPNWRTRGYEAACNANAFDTYVRDVQFAPDGSYFSIVTTGGPYPGTLCDTATRWDTATTGLDVRPRWIAVTGGDTLFSVAVSGAAVYVGGHQRWLNNDGGRDFAGPGAVPRPGLAALDARSGVPLSWNAARHPRGIGAEALLVTADGLYVGSDTEYIGNREYRRPRLAFLPLAGGGKIPSDATTTLPADVYLGGRLNTSGTAADALVARFFTGTTASADVNQSTGDLQWSRVRGAFVESGKLFYGYRNSAGSYRLFQRTFDGASFGSAQELSTPYLDPKWSGVSTGSGQTYRGALPTFYGTPMNSVTAMFYRDGKLYYNRTNSDTEADDLFYRPFSPESGIVGAEVRVVDHGFAGTAGMFVSGDHLYVADRSTGELRRRTFTNGVPGGTSTVVSGPSRDGRDWRARAVFLGPAPNAAPTATASNTCLGLTCNFDASGSADTDGSIASYAWDFGDGATGTGTRVQHAYTAGGTYTARLTVTDDDGATGETTTTVTVAAPQPGEGISLRGSAGTSARTVTSVTVTVPSSVRAGDGLVLVLSTNSASITGAAPAGFTEAGSQASSTAMATQVFERVAVAGDAGDPVTISLSGVAKVTAQLVAYSGTAATGPVASVTGASDGSGTAHTTPTATAEAGSWVMSVWSDKASAARQWTAPSRGVTERSNLVGIGSGDIATLLADSGAAVPAGTVGGLTATVSATSSWATMLTVVLRAGAEGGDAPTANQLPTAAFASSCSGLVCAFDATESIDADGSIASYAWDFGDGTTATGATAEHAYAAAGDYTVRLVVTDDGGAEDDETAMVPVADPPATGSAIGLRGSAGASARAVTSVDLTVPESVQAGDGLILVLSTNTSSVTGTAPAGFVLVGSQTTSTAMVTQVFERVAEAADPGATLRVTLSGVAKVTAQLMAYTGTATEGPVASVTGASNGSGTEHTTPTATAADGNWVLSVWSDKGPEERVWTAPSSGMTERSNLAGIGTGDIATLLADSGAAVPAGTVGGLTATVSATSTRATMLTIVIR